MPYTSQAAAHHTAPPERMKRVLRHGGPVRLLRPRSFRHLPAGACMKAAIGILLESGQQAGRVRFTCAAT
jgi:hypothetical protein